MIVILALAGQLSPATVSAKKGSTREASSHSTRRQRRRPVAAAFATVGSTRCPPIPNACAPPPRARGLLIPVKGVLPEQLRDTFDSARAGGRIHDAIDIPAPRNTPVLAALDGVVLKLFRSVRGGVTVNQLGNDGRTVYYYAHLSRYAAGIAEGAMLQQGEVIGYVGDTGNAGPGAYHLHFAIWTAPDLKRYWEGVNVNPYPLLRGE